MDLEILDNDNKGYQLRVRISAKERELLDKIRTERAKGETVSDVVRAAIALLIEKHHGGQVSGGLQKKVSTLATLLKREPKQVEEACVEGIFDLIENKARVPLIVMESQLHLSYGNPGDSLHFPWEV